MTSKKTKPEDTDAVQSEKFRQAVRDLEAAGELSPTGDEVFDQIFKHAAPPAKDD